MPAYLPGSESLAVKLVSIFPHNHDLGIPSHQALIAVFDAETGAPAAIMDGEHITAMRTAAGSALATRLLARPDANVLAILGTGVQASAHAVAIPLVRPITEIRIAGRNADRARAMAVALSVELGIPAEGTDSFEGAVLGADVVCACTHADYPILQGKWLSSGTHVNSVGLNFQGRELDEEVVRSSKVFVESRQAALAAPPAGANDLTWPIRDGIIDEIPHPRRNRRACEGRPSGPHLRRRNNPLQVRRRGRPGRRCSQNCPCGRNRKGRGSQHRNVGAGFKPNPYILIPKHQSISQFPRKRESTLVPYPFEGESSITSSPLTGEDRACPELVEGMGVIHPPSSCPAPAGRTAGPSCPTGSSASRRPRCCGRGSYRRRPESARPGGASPC